MNNEKKTLTEAVPAARELRRVPGYDPLAFTREVTAKDGKKYLTLDLKHKKTWFRLACPNGSMLLSALQVNNTTAMFEAKVLADKDDRNPLASYIAVRTADKTTAASGQHIRAAQDEALNEALDNAGFGLQLGDIIKVSDGSGYGSIVPLSEVEAARKAEATTNQVDKVSGAVSNVEPGADERPRQESESERDTDQEAAPVGQADNHTDPNHKETVKPATGTNKRPAPVGPPPHGADFTPPAQRKAGASAQSAGGSPAPAVSRPQETNPKAMDTSDQSRAAVLDIGTGRPVEQLKETDGGHVQTSQDAKPEMKPQAEPSAVTEPAEAAPAETTESAPVTYTADMTVEEICERMTLEQAKAYTINQGTCKGWTLEQVAADRFSSLKWFTTVCPFADNIMKAAAQLVLKDVELKKAG